MQHFVVRIANKSILLLLTTTAFQNPISRFRVLAPDVGTKPREELKFKLL